MQVADALTKHLNPRGVAVVVTAPLTTDEAWVAFEPGRVYTFEDGDLTA